MQPVSELSLPLLAIQEPAFANDPMPFIEAARKQHAWLARTDVGLYFVHQYEAIKELAYMDDKTEERAAYPAYWGPFSVVGEGAVK